MVAGHFGFAAGVKAKERQVPLWMLMLATVWLDVVFAPLLILGIERLEPVPGTKGGYGNSIIHTDSGAARPRRTAPSRGPSPAALVGSQPEDERGESRRPSPAKGGLVGTDLGDAPSNP
jgi:hypothetical protein